MARAFIQVGLVLLATLALIHISKAEIETDEQKQLEPKFQRNLEKDIEFEELNSRIVREAGRNSRNKGQRPRKQINEKKKTRKSAKTSKKSKTKARKNGKDRKRSKKNSKQTKKKSRNNNVKGQRKKKHVQSKTRTGEHGKTKKNTKRNKKRQSKTRTGKKGRAKKKSKKTKKNKEKKTKKKSGNPKGKRYRALNGKKTRQVCDEAALCQKIKDYIKISNQLRKVNRIIKSCDTMEKKANKSATAFAATVAALDTAIGSRALHSRQRMYISKWRRTRRSVDDVTAIKDKLKECSKTAKALCERSSVAACLETDLLTDCKKELEDWVKAFGPAPGSCLKESENCCACITALPDVKAECLDFVAKSESAVSSKKDCTSTTKEGSFGECRKQQQLAAEKGPAVACSGSSTGTVTSGPTLPQTTAKPTTAAPTTAVPTGATSAPATTSSSSTDYCSISTDHTMCKYSGPSTDCKAKTVKRELTAADKQAIVDKHNELRRTVAKGEETRGNPGPQPAASDMLMMVWDDELATIAQRWADQCTFGHDTKRDTAEGYVGQNAYIGSSSAEMSDSSLAASYTGSSTAWYEEVSDPGFSKDSVNPFVFSSGAGHYTQLVWGSSRKLGCGSVYYNSGSGSFPYNQLIVCNYFSGGNVGGTAMYKAGTACSACPADYPTCSDGLCTK